MMSNLYSMWMVCGAFDKCITRHSLCWTWGTNCFSQAKSVFFYYGCYMLLMCAFKSSQMLKTEYIVA